MEPRRGASPAADAARRADFAEARHALEDGLALAYRDYPAAAGAAAGRQPVVCLHAMSRNMKDFEDVAPGMAATGRRVIVPSLRGRGRSSWDPKPERYHPAFYAADVLALLGALAIPRAVFVGTSLGGIVSMVIAAADPTRIAACVLNDVGGELASAGLERIKSYVGRDAPARDWAEAASQARQVNAVAFPKETSEAFWLAFARRTRIESEAGIVADYDPAIGDVMRAAPAAPGALWPVFDALKPVPTLVIRGALSDLLTPETVAEMRARKPDLSFVEVPDVGHAPLLTEPSAAAALEAFLAAVE
jgi:pimeloyl-ACP methyl ester carboxylesterase